MFINDINIINFNKNKKEKKKKDNKFLKNIKGAALVGGGGAVGIQSIRSGVPRLLGARLEQHGTSKSAAKNIIKEGYLDPAYGGSQGGVTASMMLPKEFLERSKGYTFLSGKNSNHPFWKERNALSPIWDVVNRKIQVLGYRGSKAGKITPKDIEGSSKFLAAQLSGLLKPFENKIKELTPEKYLENIKKQADLEKNPLMKKYYESLIDNPDKIEKALKEEKRNIEKITKQINDIKKQGYQNPTRVKAIRKTQKKYKTLLNEYLKDIKTRDRSDSKVVYWGTDKIAKKQANELSLDNFLKEKALSGDKKAKRLINLKKSLNNQLDNQQISKQLGLSAAWGKKLVSSPGLGLLGVGKTLYLPGTDDYFNNTDRFKYDIDDPFGNPFKMQKALQSEQGGMGGNALKTKEKVRAFGNRFSATKYLLKKEGDGNILKGAKKLIKANPKRALAGAAILGLGGAASATLVKKGINKIKENDKPQKRIIKVKSSIRNGKIIKGFNRLNPFYGKKKTKKK